MTGDLQDCGPEAVSVSKSSTLTEMSCGLTRPWGGKCMTSRTRAGALRGAAEDGVRGRAAKGRPHRAGVSRRDAPCPSLDRIKREKGVWWMPWQQEAMKDVIPCDKQRGAGNGL